MENKKNGGNGIYIAIIIVLLGIIAFCAYKIGTTGRCVVDDSNAQKGGNTSVPVEDVTNDTKEVTTTNSGNVKSESADERFKKYAENLKNARSKYDDKNGFWQYQIVSSGDNAIYISLLADGTLSIDYNKELKEKYNVNGQQAVEKNVLDFYVVSGTSSMYPVLYAIKEDGTVSKIIFTEYPCLVNATQNKGYQCNHGNFDVTQNYKNLKNITTVLTGNGYKNNQEYPGTYVFFVDVDGKMTIDDN